MAELHVEPKKHSAGATSWIWIVLGIILAAIVVWLIVANNNKNENATQPVNTTGAVIQATPHQAVVTEVSYRTVTL